VVEWTEEVPLLGMLLLQLYGQNISNNVNADVIPDVIVVKTKRVDVIIAIVQSERRVSFPYSLSHTIVRRPLS
jgi:hypothetical protein